MKTRTLPLLAAVCALSGCRSVGPDYQAPRPPPEGNLAAGPVSWTPAAPVPVPVAERWWDGLPAPELRDFLDAVASQNLQLAAGLARLDEARARLGLARAEGSVGASASGTSRLAGEGAQQTLPLPGGAYPYRSRGDTYRLAADVTWEIDLWGRVRRSREAAEATFQAQEGELEGLRLSLTTEAAAAWLSRAGLQREEALLAETVTLREEQAELLASRQTSGLAPAVDVERARAEAASSAAEKAEIARRIHNLDTALALLAGRTTPPSGPAGLPPPLAVTGELPSSLLLRRPDVAAAERTLAARTAEIGVARAAFFPQVRLTGAAGFESADLGALLERPAQFWQVGPAVSYPLLDGGRTRRSYEGAQARARAAHEDYQQRLLTAFREVSDALGDMQGYSASENALARATAAAAAAESLARKRYEAGLTSYLEVLDAQRSVLAARRALLQTETQRSLAGVRLLKALGGRWN